MQANFLPHLTRKLIVDGVTGAGSNDATFNRFTNQCKITDNVQQFVTGTLIRPNQWFVIDVPQLIRIHVRNTHYISQFVIAFL